MKKMYIFFYKFFSIFYILSIQILRCSIIAIQFIFVSDLRTGASF